MSSNPVTNAFFLGRALAEVLSEKLEDSFTNAMSDLGKFDAEQREHLRQFVEEVQLRAEQVATNTSYSSGGTTNVNSTNSHSGDLQAMLDQLRAEIATLRAELKKYRN
jgi:methyl-accepting chemotaxis protein